MQVNLTGHTFEPVDQTKKIRQYLKGLEASFEALSSGSFDDHDFYDTTIETLNVAVAGGGK